MTMTKAINMVNITGNPFAQPTKNNAYYAAFEFELSKNLSAVVINDHHLIDDKGYMKKRTQKP